MRNLLLVLAAIASLSLNAQQVAKTLKASNGTQIGFLEYKPTDYSTSKPKYPLIIFLHGTGERGNGTTEIQKVANVGIAKLIKKGNPMKYSYNGKSETFLVLSPQLSLSYSGWQPFYVDAMIEYAKANLNVDPNRIYLTGLSLGGGGVWSFSSGTLVHASELAAIVPICGTCALSSPSNIANGDLAVWAFHAENDKRVSVNCTKNAIKNINAKNPKVKPKMTIWPTGDHYIWDRVYDPSLGYLNIYPWLLSHSRSGVVATTNKKPVANAGPDVTLKSGVSSVKLNGSESSDPDGSIASYSWKKVSGPVSGLLGTATGSIAELTNLTIPGTYEYELKVVDDKGASATDKVRVIVPAVEPAPNKKPVADAGSNVSITLPVSSVTLKGTGSKDNDGKIAAYKWTKVSGPAGFKIATPGAASTSISALKAGTYIFRLTVTDDKKSTDFDDVQVVVKAAVVTNKAPVANAGGNQIITLPNGTATVSGSSSTDQDGKIAKYAWKKVSGPASFRITNAGAVSTSITKLTAGVYTFRLTVTDDDKSTDYDDVTITVKAKPASTEKPTNNRAPIVRVGGTVTTTLPADDVSLSGRGSKDPDGTIVSYRWSVLSGPSGSTFSAANGLTTKISNLKQGTYLVRLEATDNDGAISYDDQKIIVYPKNTPPVANAGENLTITLPKDKVILDGRGSRDPDGSIVSYHWGIIQASGKYSFANSSAIVTTVDHLTEGVYIIRLETIDNKGARAYDDTKITVLPFNQPPVVDAGENMFITLPINKVTLNGKASKDPDGSIVSYKWRVLKGPDKYSFSNSSEASTLLTNLTSGTYTLRLEAMDNRGAIAYDDMNVVVHDGSKADAARTNSAAATAETDQQNSNVEASIDQRSLAMIHGNGTLRTYPNPTHSTMTLEFSDSTLGKAIIHIYDINGRIIKNLSAQKNQLLLRQQIDVGNLLNGVYMLEVNVNDKTKINTRFIKQ